jgi:asparagine synthase (glutamine-hydrolysing)
MCGIAGLAHFRGGRDRERLHGIAQAMADRLAHRGPDAQGIFVDAAAGVGLGHRRLSILDLTPAGAQPMSSDCGRLTVAFNGELYNHLDVRAELAGAGEPSCWRGHSDTETMLVAVRRWGFRAALERFVGMFAVALFDRRDNTLSLARDRFGEKPLYYAFVGGDLVFASELKDLAGHPDWSPQIDRGALTLFMRRSCIATPFTVWADVKKLPPGTFLTLSLDPAQIRKPLPQPYWRFADAVNIGRQARISNEGGAIDELERLLSIAVRRQCLSDVPLGAFLSGGIDSSTIVALLQKQGGRPVRTFTIGFSDDRYDEARAAAAVARHLGTDHTELYVDDATLRDVIPRLPDIYDEPFADSSQIPTFLVSQLARRHVTVALSGDGGDEMFGGYNRHVLGPRLWQYMRATPVGLRKFAAAAFLAAGPRIFDAFSRGLEPVLPEWAKLRRIGDQAIKFSGVVDAENEDELYRRLSSIDRRPAATVLGGTEPPLWSECEMPSREVVADFAERMMVADTLGYLTDDILTKVDRAAMAVSLEARVPFLDVEVVNFACRVPVAMKVRDGRGKWLLRQVLYRHVPPALVDRPKTGFSVPIDAWLRGPLRSFAIDLLSPGRIRTQGLFDADVVSGVLDAHLRGVRDAGHWLWNVLMAQAWLDRWGSPSRIAPHARTVRHLTS